MGKFFRERKILTTSWFLIKFKPGLSLDFNFNGQAYNFFPIGYRDATETLPDPKYSFDDLSTLKSLQAISHTSISSEPVKKSLKEWLWINKWFRASLNELLAWWSVDVGLAKVDGRYS